ncbi:MAG: DUF2127 domain-containing protein [Candidatus Nanoarchaeia archaeon]|nr:DUF2127 domain-containing protein [Candidatus Nanoarchaeia archaeon]MDD5740683.1 DUF2127 domain-containing protein [Candidatus Nanoarchaeia archaeon]
MILYFFKELCFLLLWNIWQIIYTCVSLYNVEKLKTVHKVFKTITILKGIHAIIEILLGIILLILNTEFISNTIVAFIEGRLVGDPSSFIAQYISQFGIDLSLSIKLFLSLYLLIHGVVNLSLVYGIIKKPFWAYPLSIVLFIGFIIYQAYSYLIFPSAWLLFLTLFDILFIGLVFYEYHLLLKKYSFLGKLKLIAEAKTPKIVEINLKMNT